MAFPTVEAVNGAQAASTSNLSVPLPAPGGGILAGDMLLAIAGGRGNTATFGWPGDWTEILDAGVSTFGRGAVAYKVAAGGETGNISVTRSAANTTGVTIYCIRSQGSFTPEVTSISTGADPSALNPASWGSEDTLWFACLTGAQNTPPTGAPTSYGNLRTTDWNTSALGGGMATARRTNNTSSEDPGAFTGGGVGGNNGAFTVGVAPVTTTAIIDGGAIASEEAFGTGVVSLTDQDITDGGGIASAEAFGTGQVASPAMIGGGGISSAEAFGVGALVYPQDLTDGGAIPSAEAVGGVGVANPLINGGGIASEEIVAGGRISWGLAAGGGIASAEAFGLGGIFLPAEATNGGGIPSEEAFGGGNFFRVPALDSVQYLRWLKARQDALDEQVIA